MTAPFIIPFNFQPVQTVVSTASYTVPAGKYSLVNTKNALLPILNSNNMYTNRALTVGGLGAVTAGNVYGFFVGAKGVHRISMTIGSSGTHYFGIGVGSTSGTSATTADFQYTWSGASATSYIFPQPVDIVGASFAAGGAAHLSAVSLDCYTGPDQIWLKAGDVLTYSAGNVTYTEYNIIS